MTTTAAVRMGWRIVTAFPIRLAGQPFVCVWAEAPDTADPDRWDTARALLRQPDPTEAT